MAINVAAISRRFGINKLVRSFLSFKKPRVKRARQQIGDMENLTLSVEVCKYDGRAAGKLPNDLATRATRRRQRLGIGDHSQRRKLSLTFRQRLPNRHPFRAHGQTITGTLNVAAGIDFSTVSPDRRTDAKI